MIPNTLPKSLVDNPRLDTWIGFEDGGKVRVATGKVELGQGIVTALAQIAAEELDVAPERLRIVSGDTGHSPNEGYTAGSLSVEGSGAAIRLACAEVRQLFVARAAETLGAEPASIAIEDGGFLRDGAPTGLDYWALAPQVDLRRDATGSAPAKNPAAFRIVGTSQPRLDLPEKLFGAPFVHDLAPEGLLHARVLHHPWGGATLASLDEAALRRAAKGAFEILREGDFLAFVAEYEAVAAAAVTAARTLAVWSGGTPVSEEAATPAWLATRTTSPRVVSTGVAAPASRLEATYTRPYTAHGSIGPSCAVALYEHDRLTVWTQSQGVFFLRTSLSGALGLDAERITLVHRQGAGCYGHNGADDAAFDAALVAMRRPGRPVRVLWMREDELGSSPVGAATVVKLTAGLDSDKRPLGWRLELWSPPHGQRPGMNDGVNLLGAEALPNPPPRPEPRDVPDERGGGASRNAVALYDFPQEVIHRMVTDTPVRVSSMRGLGAFANVFAIESFVDELADAAGVDPVAYRLSLMSDPRARAVIETAAAMADWGPQGSGTGRAKGIAFSRYKNRSGYCALVAEVEVEEEVRVRRVWCAVDAGLAVNPDGVINQAEGGIIQATSWTLKEEVRFAGGRIASDTWDQYPILRFPEVPEVEVRLIGNRNDPPLGVGEVSQGPTAAAIGNAVARALGVRIRDLPLTRERIVATMV
jgi:CO/xanthine dehydrogenase Mo-binding subunit